MKNFVKLIPVALGLLTLASCSENDLFSEDAQIQKPQAGDLYVVNAELEEDGSNFTRSFLALDMVKHMWVPSDELRVYDNDLHKYDIYQFAWKGDDPGSGTGTFRRKNTVPNITTPMWALFPKEDVVSGEWVYDEISGDNKTVVTMHIPGFYEYNAAYNPATYATDKTPLYNDLIPRWGAVKLASDAERLETSLNWMTGILRLQLAGTPAYADGVRIRLVAGGVNAYKINGDFKTTIASNGVKLEKDEAFLASTKKWGPADVTEIEDEGSIYIHIPQSTQLTDKDNRRSVIYVPLVIPEDVVDIEIALAKDLETKCGVTDKGALKLNDQADLATATWEVYKVLANKTVKAGKVYGNKNEYNLAVEGTTPGAIGDALELIEETGKITLKAKNPIGICDPDNTIYIPNKENVTDVVIDLTEGVYKDCNNTLFLKYKNPADKFKGTVTLLTRGVTGSKIRLNVDLDETSFAYAGDAVGGADGTAQINAVEFTLGDPTCTVVTDYSADPGKFPFVLSDNVTAFTLAEDAKYGKPITIDPATINKKVAKVVIKGNLSAGIDASAATQDVNVFVSGETATIDKAKDIITTGTVSINAGKEGARVDVAKDITAKKAISVTGFVDNYGNFNSGESITISGSAACCQGATTLDAKGDITISQQATVGAATVTSEEGNIVFSNEYAAATNYGCTITAKKGSITLSEAGDYATSFTAAIDAKVDVNATGNVIIGGTITAGQDVKLSGKADAQNTATITAGRDFEVTQEAKAEGEVNLSRTATVNITTNGGDAVAVGGWMNFRNGAAYALNLLSGYVKNVDAQYGAVALSFATSPAFAAIANVNVPDNLVPITKSIWNGKPMTVDGAYFIDNGRIWTGSQLGMQQGATGSTSVEIRSDIDLNYEEWAGIEPTGAYTIEGKYKTISKVRLMGNSTDLTAGFINKIGNELIVRALTFDGVKTDITAVSGGVYNGGIGAVAGQTSNEVLLQRVIVKLAGANFGTNTEDNAKTAAVGGLIGYAGAKVTLEGTQVTATGSKLTGYRKMGGFIGVAADDVDIKMAQKVGNDIQVKPAVTGLEFYVTYDATEGGFEYNDPDQGTTGWFIGSIDVTDKVTIVDVAPGDVYRAVVAGGKANEAKSIYIETPTDYFWFKRDPANADQTLIGLSGFVKDAGQITINGRKYEVFKTGVPFVVGSPKLYSLIKDSYIH